MKPLNQLLLASFTALALAGAANAQTLAHRYSFNDTGDSVGTANGTLLGTTSTISAGVLNTVSTTSGAFSGGLSIGSAATAGITGAFSIETYFTPSIKTINANIFSFQPAATGQNFTNYFGASITNPGGGGALGLRTFYNAPGGADFVNERTTPAPPVPFDIGTLYQLVSVYDPAGNAGAGSLSFYLNGSLGGSTSTLGDAFNFSLFQGSVIAGSSNFPDPNLPGTTTDFRIYNGALSAAQVASLNTAGPDATNAAVTALVPEPSTTMMLILGAGAFCGFLRSRSRLRAG